MSAMKTKPKLRARRMFANYYPAANVCVYLHRTRTRANSMENDDCSHAAVPVAVIPLDAPESLVNKAVKGFFRGGQLDAYSDMRAALTAIGVLPRTRKGGRK